MKNKMSLMIFALFLVLTGIASADVQQISTTINLASSNNTVTVGTEDKEFTFTCGQSLGSRTINFVREINCGNTDELRTIASTLSANLNDSKKYYDKYLECYGQNILCQQKIGGNSSINWESKYSETLTSYQQCNGEKSSLLTARQASDTQLSTCQSDLKKAESDKTFWGIGGVILGLAAYYFLFDKSRKKPAMSVAEQQLPRSR